MFLPLGHLLGRVLRLRDLLYAYPIRTLPATDLTGLLRFSSL